MYTTQPSTQTLSSSDKLPLLIHFHFGFLPSWILAKNI